MIQSSIAAFVVSYFSVFHAPRMDLFWCSYLPILLLLIYFSKSHHRTIYVGVFFFVWTQGAVQLQIESQYNLEKKATVTLELEITQIPQVKSRSISFIATPIRIIETNVDFDFMRLKKIKLNWYQADKSLKGGQLWRMQIRLQPPHGYQNGVGFDYERWMFAESISATGYVLNKYKPQMLGVKNNDVILQARTWLAQKIQNNANGLTNLALFQTLSMGDKSLLEPTLNQLFIDTGTAHLLVISGLHVGLLSMMFYFLASRLWLLLNKRFKTRLNQSDFSIIIGWLSAFIYSALAGFSLPTVRALIMLSLVFITLLKRQNNSFLNAFSTAIIVVLLLMPLSLLSFSFWLSFLAVLLILLSQYRLRSYSKIQGLLMLQLMFALLFIPLNAVIFNQLIMASFFANLVLIPVMGFIVIPINLLAAILSVFDWAWLHYVYQFLDVLISYLIDYLRFINNYLGGALPLSEYNTWLMLLSALGALILILVPNASIKFPAIILIVMPWFYYDNELPFGDAIVSFFDVGMGTSVLIKTQQHALLYDFGPGNNTSYQPALWVIKPYLQAKNIKSLDRAIISHSDQDHYGGFWALKDEAMLKSTELLTGTKQKTEHVFLNANTFKNCHQEAPWVWDGVAFKFLALKSKHSESDNNRSCVLKMTTKHGSLLLTGDIELKREQELLTYYSDELNADIMLVPHHGSRTSSSTLFLHAVSPKFAVTTAGFLNRWGFPKEDVIKRYGRLDTVLFNTGLDGLVTFKFSADGIDANAFRHDEKLLWY